MILFLLIFFGLQAFVLFCCLVASDDPVSRQISDREQEEFLAEWAQRHNKQSSH